MSKNNSKKRILEIVNAYLQGKATPEEYVFLNDYYECVIDDDAGDSELTEEQWAEITKRIRDGVEIKLSKHYQKYNIKNLFLRYLWPVAFAAVLLIISCIWFGALIKGLNQNIAGLSPVQRGVQYSKEIIMTLGSGIRVTLDNKQHKEIPSLPGVKGFLPKADQLVLTNKILGKDDVRYITIQAPKGVEFELTLPDGTLVHLNPESVLKFPNVFPGHERRIELSGSAHFDVASKIKKPFKVYTSRKEFTATESHFDIDEAAIKTTSL